MMRGRPPHPGEQSWDQIFGAPVQAAPLPGAQPQQQAFPHAPAHPQQQWGGHAGHVPQTPAQQAPQHAQQRHYEPLGMRLAERTVLRVRRHGRRLLLPSIVLVAGVASAAYNLGALQEATIGLRHAWLLVSLAAVVLLGIVPVVVWLQSRHRITTRRIVLSHGTFTSETREVGMNAVVDVTVRRTLWQRMFGSGTIVVTSITGQRFRLVDVPAAESIAACIRELSGP